MMPHVDDTPQQDQDHRRHQSRARGRIQQEQGNVAEESHSTAHRHHRRRPPRSEQPHDEPSQSTTSSPSSHPTRPSRRERFKAKLTETTPSDSPSTEKSEAAKPKPKPRQARKSEPPGDDLTSTLTHALRTPPFPDCPICFSPIRPEHHTWSCSPLVSSSTEARPKIQDAEGSQCCWSTFHLKCIRPWADKSVKELAEAWRARGEERPGEWHCPGCRATRQAVPQIYTCFCLRMRNPTPPRMATPHSCAQPCSRLRSACKHPCPLPCHPGPCPPCAVTIQASCFCGKERHSAKCRAGERAVSFSCAQPCRKELQCGHPDHRCSQMCHEGPCPPCPLQEEVRCFCGRETKHVACGEVKPEDGTKCIIIKDDGSEQVWMGSYGCGHPCQRPFACFNHSCSKPCHPPSQIPPPCPFEPERVVSCACGRHRIARSFDEFVSSGNAHASSALLKPRTSCTEPRPTCTSSCSKPLPCGHPCQATCHWDACPPCIEYVERTCRCGATKHKTPCGDAVLARLPTDGDTILASEAILCDKPCMAMRSCGRHPCGRICCPLGPLQRTKHTKRRDPDALIQLQLQLDPATRALHQCDLPCNRVLACGNHHCQERDHRGPCPPCPRGVFEELICLCGRTTLEPPIQCGTRLQCVYSCARPPPVCGHPHVPHLCHEGVVIAGADVADEGLGVSEKDGGGDCPSCPFLTEKVCACGKKQVGNVRCSQERVNCGSVCGKLLSCGFHHCERLCHADPCGTCTAVCGKSRKSCLPAHHPCTQTCHAPAACPETEPCLTPVTLTCPCGNLRSTVPCSGTKLALACTGDCDIKKRNARLAEALGISEEKRENAGKAKGVTWASELVVGARGMGQRFVGVVEKAFVDFINSDRKIQVLPHMRPDQRKFVHDLALVYRMDTVMVDQEPHRSVQLIRRIDTRVPVPLLSQHITSSMGRLVDSRLTVGRGPAATANAGGGAGGGSAWGTSGSTGSGRWNEVARAAMGAGVSRSGSSTPARVPSPGLGPGRLAGVDVPSGGNDAPSSSSTGMIQGGGAKGTVWVSPSVLALQARDSGQALDEGRSAPFVDKAGTGAGTSGPDGTGSVGAGVAQETVLIEEVPGNWEDDV